MFSETVLLNLKIIPVLPSFREISFRGDSGGFNMEKTLYTITIFSENTVGLLGQITIIFTRRALNIETLSVSQSALSGIHKFTITLFSTQDVVEKVVKQIDKRIDILKAYYNTDDDLIYQEIAHDVLAVVNSKLLVALLHNQINELLHPQIIHFLFLVNQKN